MYEGAREGTRKRGIGRWGRGGREEDEGKRKRGGRGEEEEGERKRGEGKRMMGKRTKRWERERELQINEIHNFFKIDI